MAGVVDFVEDDEGLGREPGQLLRRAAHRELLVGRDQAVDVAGQAVAGRPVGVELQAHPVGCLRPLDLEVAGWCHDDQRSVLVGKRGAGAGQCEGRLTGARCGDRQVVRSGRGAKEIERSALPRAEGDGRHERVRVWRADCSGTTPDRSHLAPVEM